MITRLFFLLLLPVFLCAENPATVEFYRGSINNAKEMAASQGKLYFVQFTATWCEPCRWMDEVTYKDPQVVAYINKNYVPVKVDIDDFDGYAYKQMYDIRMLPTVLVFSSDGRLLEKYEESLPPPKMLKILKLHDTPGNRTYVAPGKKQQSYLAVGKETIHSPVRENISRPPLKPASPAPAPNTEVSNSVAETPVYREETEESKALHRFKVTYGPSKGYSVQIGIYSEYGNVLQKAAKVEHKLGEPLMVHISRETGKTSYIVMVGEFQDRAAAMQCLRRIEAKGISGIVKDLSMLK